MLPYTYVRLGGCTFARIVLALALLLLAVGSVPALLFWPAWPGRVERLLIGLTNWTTAILKTGDALESSEPEVSAAVSSEVIELDPVDPTDGTDCSGPQTAA